MCPSIVLLLFQDFFYSRKKFMKPELQHKMHQNFEDEVGFDTDFAYFRGRFVSIRPAVALHNFTHLFVFHVGCTSGRSF